MVFFGRCPNTDSWTIKQPQSENMQIPGVPLQHKMKYNNCCAYDFKELGKEVYLDKSFPALFVTVVLILQD